MNVHYNKKGRVQSVSSPADIQRRRKESNNVMSSMLDKIDELSRENALLQSERVIPQTLEVTSAGMFTQDEVDEIVNKEVIKAMESNKIPMNNFVDITTVKNFEETVENLKEIIRAKDLLIDTLKQTKTVLDPNVPTENINRPKINDNIVIDPTEKKEIKSHINIKEEKGENITDKLNKLKLALGK